MSKQILAKRRLETTISADPRIAMIVKAVYRSLYTGIENIEITESRNSSGNILITVNTRTKEWQDYPEVVIARRDPSTIRKKVPDGY